MMFCLFFSLLPFLTEDNKQRIDSDFCRKMATIKVNKQNSTFLLSTAIFCSAQAYLNKQINWRLFVCFILVFTWQTKKNATMRIVSSRNKRGREWGNRFPSFNSLPWKALVRNFFSLWLGFVLFCCLFSLFLSFFFFFPLANSLSLTRFCYLSLWVISLFRLLLLPFSA